MANKRQKLEAEILRIRNQCCLDNLKEGLKQVITKYGSTDPIVKLVENEVQLESYLLDFAPHPDNVNTAKSKLSSVKKNLQDLKQTDSKNSLFSIPVEASILLVKVYYAQGNTSQCLELFQNLALSTQRKDLSLYKKRMFSDAFAIKGLCIEQQPSSSTKTMKKDCIDCYESSINLLIQYMFEYEKANPTVNVMSEENLISFFSETAIYHGAIACIIAGKLWDGVKMLRRVLKVLHSCLPLRVQQVITCKLAVILLRGTCPKDYRMDKSTSEHGLAVANSIERTKKSDMMITDDSHISSSSSHSKPKFFLGEKKFTPSVVEQEAILVLLISEIMLNIDPVLDMSPDHAHSREETLRNAETVYSLLAVACCYLGQYDVLNMSIEKSLKYAFDRHHIWSQYALSLSASAKSAQALPCISECLRINPNDISSALLGAKLCYEQQSSPHVEEGLHFAYLAVDMAKEAFDSDGMKSRAYLALGVGKSLKALTGKYYKERIVARNEAIAAYTKAHEVDPYDHKALLFLAYEFAHVRELSLAFNKLQRAIELQPEDYFAHHLLALLFTARGQYEKAKHTLDGALDMYPEDMRLLTTKSKLAQMMGDDAEALRSCDELLKIWSTRPERNLSLPADNTTVDRFTNDGLSVANLSIGAEVDRVDTGSMIANSMVYSRQGHALSEVTSSLGDLQPRLAAMTSARSEAWLQVAEIYLALEREDEAQNCVTEALQVHPLLPSVLYMRGRLFEYRGEVADACTMYNNALTIDPFHVKATERYARILCEQGKLGLAKKLLQDVIIHNASHHVIWQILGEVLELDGDIEAAIECCAFAVKLEESAPLIPFSILVPHL